MNALVLAMTAALSFEIIDRIAVSVDEQVITDSEIRQEIRITAFLDGVKPDLSAANRRRTADRLVEQILMRREMRFTQYPEPTPEDVDEQLKQVRARFPSDADYRAALERAKLTAAEVREAIQRAIAVVRFIDLRFRPEVQVVEPELMEYFQKQCLPEWRKSHTGPDPTFDELRQECEDKLVSERVDARIESWLKEAKGRARIRYEEDAFQ